MPNLRMQTELIEDSHHLASDSANSSLKTKKTDSSTTVYLVTHCVTLLKKNFSKYDKCVKYQEKLRLQLIKANKDYKYLRTVLENAKEACFTMKSNDSHLTQLYEILQKNDFIEDFVKHGVAREQLDLKFFSTMTQVKDLRESLSVVDSDMTSLKSECEKVQYREVPKQITTEECLEYAELGKALRLKSVNIMYECERLSTFLQKSSEDMVKLKSEDDDLTRCFRILMKNTTVKELLDYTEHQEKVESLEKLDKRKFSKPSLRQVHDENDSSINLQLLNYQEKLIAEQQRREKIEKEYSSMEAFSDKLCRLLFKYQSPSNNRIEKFITDDSIQNFSFSSSSIPSNTDVAEEFPSRAASENSPTELKEENNQEMVLSEHEFTVQVSVLNPKEDDHLSEKLDISPNNHSIFPDENHKSSANKIVADSLVKECGPSKIEKRDPVVKNELSSSLNSAKIPALYTQKPLSATKVECELTMRFNKQESPTTKCNSAYFQCKICNEFFVRDHRFRNHKCNMRGSLDKYKCTVCGKGFTRKYSVSKHMAIKHTFLHLLKCSFCDWATKYPSNLRQHLKNVHNKDIRRYCCAHCGERFSLKENMFHHICSVHFSGMLEHVKCTVCHKMYQRKSHMFNHLRTYHSKFR